MDPLDEIRRLYFTTTRTTIRRDLARAVALLTSMPTDADRERARVFMEGLAAMRSEWAESSRPRQARKGRRP
jgi:hypothetical protein